MRALSNVRIYNDWRAGASQPSRIYNWHNLYIYIYIASVPGLPRYAASVNCARAGQPYSFAIYNNQ